MLAQPGENQGLSMKRGLYLDRSALHQEQRSARLSLSERLPSRRKLDELEAMRETGAVLRRDHLEERRRGEDVGQRPLAIELEQDLAQPRIFLDCRPHAFRRELQELARLKGAHRRRPGVPGQERELAEAASGRHQPQPVRAAPDFEKTSVHEVQRLSRSAFLEDRLSLAYLVAPHRRRHARELVAAQILQEGDLIERGDDGLRGNGLDLPPFLLFAKALELHLGHVGQRVLELWIELHHPEPRGDRPEKVALCREVLLELHQLGYGGVPVSRLDEKVGDLPPELDVSRILGGEATQDLEGLVRLAAASQALGAPELGSFVVLQIDLKSSGPGRGAIRREQDRTHPLVKPRAIREPSESGIAQQRIHLVGELRPLDPARSLDLHRVPGSERTLERPRQHDVGGPLCPTLTGNESRVHLQQIVLDAHGEPRLLERFSDRAVEEGLFGVDPSRGKAIGPRRVSRLADDRELVAVLNHEAHVVSSTEVAVAIDPVELTLGHGNVPSLHLRLAESEDQLLNDVPSDVHEAVERDQPSPDVSGGGSSSLRRSTMSRITVGAAQSRGPTTLDLSRPSRSRI